MILFSHVRGAFGEITSREWALLALETLGVVAGILIAFELNEWASRRSQAAKHQQLMERLFEESQMDVAVFRQWRKLLGDQVKEEQKFATAISQGKCPADWAGIETLTLMPAITAPTSVYEELKGAGGLASVDSLPVRVELANFHYQLGWVQQQVVYFRAGRIDPIPNSDPRITTKVDFTREEPEYSTYDREALCADHGFRNRVAAAARSHTVYASYFTDMTDNAISMCAALGDSMGKPCSPDPAIGGPLKGADAKLASKTVTEWRKKVHSLQK